MLLRERNFNFKSINAVQRGKVSAYAKVTTWLNITADDNAIDESTVILERISGALRMANLDEAAQMLDAASKVAVDHLSPANSSSN